MHARSTMHTAPAWSLTIGRAAHVSRFLLSALKNAFKGDRGEGVRSVDLEMREDLLRFCMRGVVELGQIAIVPLLLGVLFA